jgi:uncharacterized membrane protein
MSAKVKRPIYLIRIGVAHKRLVISAVLGIVIILLVPAAMITRMLIGWDGGVAVYLAAAAVMMTRRASPNQMKANAAQQDEGAFAILILSAAAAMASLGAIFAELAVVERADPYYGFYGALAVGTVVLSWAFIHSIFALHYAHEFYDAGARRNGLKFPGDAQPDYWDFIYFSFVIEMTFQVSDVAVTHKSIRRIVVAHGALSFFFMTAVVAMMVNVAANVIQK